MQPLVSSNVSVAGGIIEDSGFHMATMATFDILEGMIYVTDALQLRVEKTP